MLMYSKKWVAYICNDTIPAISNSKSNTYPNWVIWIHQSQGNTHCEECLKLDNCWFWDSKTPKHPHHLFCHCILEELPYSMVLAQARADADYRKFDPYLFNTDGTQTHHKEDMLKQWGYTVEDSMWLHQEFIRQGLEKYIKGEYDLGLLNEHGQRINIAIEIPRKDIPDKAAFRTGWMVYPNGKIQLVTPYGGKIKNEIFR